MNPLKASNFRELNAAGVVERANDIITAVKMMGLNNNDAKALAKAQMMTHLESGDTWESGSWHLVYLEFFERVIRDEDPQCESNSKHGSFYGGFVGE